MPAFLSKEDCKTKLQAVIDKAVSTGTGVGVVLTKDGDLRVIQHDGCCRSEDGDLGGVGPGCSYLDIISVLEEALPLPSAVNFRLDSRYT